MNRQEALIAWYRAGHRDLPWRTTRDAYRIWLSEIMLQQTRVAAVIPYYERFLAELPTVQDLAAVDDDRLMKLWQGLGYYSRARNLKRAAIEIVQRFGGVLPRTFSELLTLPGIGRYTAAAIASIAFGERVPAVDGNVLRVTARLDDDARDIADPAVKDAVFEALSADMPEAAGEFNQAMMELGAVICLPNGEPLCERCPLADMCKARQNGTVRLRPVKSPKRKRKVEPMTVLVLRHGDAFLIRKRPKTGLLAGLYELPHLEGAQSSGDAMKSAAAMGLRPVGEITQYDRVHIFTHKEWHMRVYACAVSGDAPEGYVWYDGTQSIPTAFGICL